MRQLTGLRPKPEQQPKPMRPKQQRQRPKHRLIRAETDRGVLMICDTRLVDKPYGKRIWQSLPPFKRTREIEVVREFFEEKTAQ